MNLVEELTLADRKRRSYESELRAKVVASILGVVTSSGSTIPTDGSDIVGYKPKTRKPDVSEAISNGQRGRRQRG